MSFKREGNDGSQLNILQKRRIKDLLGVGVPEDEALLTCNGRLACLVCGHRPVFDTLDMLIVHRRGKKHIANAEYENARKQELKHLIMKRKHDQYLIDGTTKIQEGPVSTHRGLGMGIPYNSRAKKRRPYDRKQRLDMPGSRTLPVGTTSSSLPGNSQSQSNKCELKLNSDIVEDNQKAYCLKQVPNNQSSNSRENMTNESFRTLLLKQQLENGPVTHSAHLNRIFTDTAQNGEHKDIKPYTSHRQMSKKIPVKHKQTPAKVYYREDRTTEQTNKLCTLDIIHLAKHPPQPPTDDKYSGKVKNKKSSDVTAKCNNSKDLSSDSRKSMSLEQREKAEQYLQCRGAGWKKDLHGKWVRDEDAEFDSDEEPPDLP